MSNNTNFDVAKTAKLARLDLQEEEKEQLRKDMEGIVEYINMLSELDVTGVEPTAHAVPLTDILRKDKAEESFSREDMLANAPATVDDDLIKVHQVVDEG